MRGARSIRCGIVAAIALALAVAMASCDKPHSPELSNYFNISADGWAYGDTLAWTPLDSAAIDTADLIVALRHANDYPYANIWLECSHYAPGDTVPRLDTINIWLADEYGRWLGTGIGVGRQLADTALRLAPIDLSQPVAVRHVMRVDCLTGVEQVGLIIK